MSKLEPKELNDYGKQLYWMAQAGYGICGDLMRSFEQADGKHEEQDEFLHRLVSSIRKSSEDCEETLERLAKENKKGYKVLK